LLIAAVLIVAAQVAGCGGGHDATTPPEAGPPLEVRAIVAESRQVSDTFEAGGTVQAQTTATLSSRIMAPVTEVRARPGDRVKAGQVLLVLDDRDLSAGARQARTASAAADEGVVAARADLEGARAALTLARASHDRVAGLKTRNSATAQEFDQAVAGLRAAEARLASADAHVRQADAAKASAAAASEAAGVAASYAVLTAPFDGLVTEKFVEPGNLASPGMPLLRVEDTAGFRLDVRVDESRAAFVKVGDTVPVLLDAAGGGARDVSATVKEVARAIDADARAFLVKLSLPAADLRSGTFGRARLPGPARQALLLPASSIVRTGQVASAFVVDGSTARLRLVHLGPSVGPLVEVISGVSAGERVVDAPPAGLLDGRALKVAGGPAAPSGDKR
jgi:RND family efflux transporter MFP subunit